MRAAEREEMEEAQDVSGYAPRNAEGRLREWSRCRWYAPVSIGASESPMYVVLNSPGRATDTAGDGGMAAKMDKDGHAIAREARVRETGRAIQSLPPALRDVIHCMYDVAQLERPRSERAVCEKLGINRSDLSRRLSLAYGYIMARLELVTVL